ncbi:hypothetical protein LWI28_007929 [Acer negundo]|uniref:Uncharacterized protein n=1 Tax=Acer negundo TaxID=4023 RepID=A0AAD5IY02_ACENE|nr:hypothetical protein LWI28_007929 [Acer negundo]
MRDGLTTSTTLHIGTMEDPPLHTSGANRENLLPVALATVVGGGSSACPPVFRLLLWWVVAHEARVLRVSPQLWWVVAHESLLPVSQATVAAQARVLCVSPITVVGGGSSESPPCFACYGGGSGACPLCFAYYGGGWWLMRVSALFGLLRWFCTTKRVSSVFRR